MQDTALPFLRAGSGRVRCDFSHRQNRIKHEKLLALNQMERKAMSEMRELTDMEVESVSGGVYDLGAYITRAVDNAIGAALGGHPGNGPGGIDPGYSPGGIDPGMTPRQPSHLIPL